MAEFGKLITTRVNTAKHGVTSAIMIRPDLIEFQLLAFVKELRRCIKTRKALVPHIVGNSALFLQLTFFGRGCSPIYIYFCQLINTELGQY